MSSQLSAVRSGFSPSRVSLPAFPLMVTWIAYGVAKPPGVQLYVAPAAGGPATLIAAGFYLAQAPVWSPDGGYLLFWGQRKRDAPPENNVDWYVAPVTGGPPVERRREAFCFDRDFRRFMGYRHLAVGSDRRKPYRISWARRRLVEHVAGGYFSQDMAGHRGAAAGDIRHHGRNGRIGDIGRANGLHQSNDGRGYLEPADRCRSRQSSGTTETDNTGSR